MKFPHLPSTWSLALELVIPFFHIAGCSKANLNQFVLVTNPSMSMDLDSPDDLQRENVISGKANAFIYSWAHNRGLDNKQENNASKTQSSLSDETQRSGQLMAVNEPEVRRSIKDLCQLMWNLFQWSAGSGSQDPSMHGWNKPDAWQNAQLRWNGCSDVGCWLSG